MHRYDTVSGVHTASSTLYRNRHRVYVVAGACTLAAAVGIVMMSGKPTLYSEQVVPSNAHINVDAKSSSSATSASTTIDVHQSSSSDKPSDVFVPPNTTTAASEPVQVTVNGVDIPVPDNGHVQTSVDGGDGPTTVNIESQNSTTGDTSSKQKIRITTRTSSSIQSSVKEDEQIKVQP